MGLIIAANQIFLENEILENGYVVIEEDRISEIGHGEVKADITLGALTLSPAFIDIHVHGGNGHDAMDMSVAAISEISDYKIKEGVGYFCPTTVTASLEKTKEAISCIRSAMEHGTNGAEVLGAFLEGPYIDMNYKGAHNEKYIREIDLDEIKDLIEFGNGAIKSFAIAPNLENAPDATELLTKSGIVVSMGHSAATVQELKACIDRGGTIAIHTFNAMSPLNHRLPGMVGGALSDDRVYCEIICDLIHVAKEPVDIVYRCKTSDKMIAITDCMMAGGLRDGKYVLGDKPVNVRDSIARTESGALAGSTLCLSTALKNLVQSVGLPTYDAVKIMTQTPAKAMNLFTEIGGIAVGKKASFTAFDKDFNVKFVMVNGDVKLDQQ